MHIIDTTMASLVDDHLRYQIKPRITLDQDYEHAKLGAEAHQIIFDWQDKMSKFTRIQRPYLLQNAIAGITVAKTYWTTREQRRRRLVTVDTPYRDEQDQKILDPFTGQPITYPEMRTQTKTVVVYDGPQTDVIDVHDFFWPKDAVDIKRTRWVAHRIWVSREELEERFQGDDPEYGPNQGGWSWAKVKKTIGEVRAFKDKGGARWGEKKPVIDEDSLEVFELYDRLKKEVITFVNRTALLAYKQEFPFFHEEVPFTVCTTQPDLFSVVGISQIEKVAALQEMLWGLMNQRIDNLRLIANAIVLFRPDVEDVDDLEFAPGAMWPLEDPGQVAMWQPNPAPAELSLGAEGLLKGDMQGLSGGFPFSSGAESQTVDNKTATGASLISSLAQRSIDLSKQGVYEALEDIGYQRLVLNQQMIREPIVVGQLGLNNEMEAIEIWPEMLAGDFEYELQPMPSAVMQQQEQAKMQAALQVMGQLAPIILQLGAQGMATMINFDALIEEYLKSLGFDNPKQFFVKEKPQAGAPAPGQGGGQGAPAPPGQGGGITGPGSIDPSVSPGAQTSMAPAAMLQQLMAAQGGGQNVQQ
jgi:hypothetical protein